ncbi:unnamed protein product [Cyclocybe aegerita]|uniref:Inosine/uridine-preferring nucleoside hydrolase domain-containing protein n=1 Tax=Cyclocybe aegerita TaxID=1973307 RepID=A0A8S0W6K2_CYCAE|nr:unnamed protein product [Cyclocybe aegerita]
MAPDYATNRIPVIIDTDPGVDDIIAMFVPIFTLQFREPNASTSLLAIASPELDILAYSISYGNTDIESSWSNVSKAYRAIDLHLKSNPSDKARFPNFDAKRRPLLARGPSGPLEGELHSAEYFHGRSLAELFGRDGLGDIGIRHPELSLEASLDTHPYFQVSSQSGVGIALDILRSYPARSVTYIALGPLTNLALMMRKDSQLVTDRVGRIVCMGGALDVPGNTSPVAEFNFFADPYAVKELLSTPLHRGLPLDRFLMLPLDITTPHELPFDIYQKEVDPTFENTNTPSNAKGKSPLTHFTSSFLERTREIMLQFGKDAMELHDIVAVWCAIENPPFPDTVPMALAPGWEGARREFQIERTGEITRGMLVTDRREDESAYPLGTNRSEAQRDPSEDHHHIGYPVSNKANGAVCDELSGVLCINRTPGPAVLLKLLLHRVWGRMVA